MSKNKQFKVKVVRNYFTVSEHTVEAANEQEAKGKAEELSQDVTPSLNLDRVDTEIMESDGKGYDPQEHGYTLVPTVEGNFYVRQTFDADPDEYGYDIYDLDLNHVGRIDGEQYDLEDVDDLERLQRRIMDETITAS